VAERHISAMFSATPCAPQELAVELTETFDLAPVRQAMRHADQPGRHSFSHLTVQPRKNSTEIQQFQANTNETDVTANYILTATATVTAAESWASFIAEIRYPRLVDQAAGSEMSEMAFNSLYGRRPCPPCRLPC